MYHASLLNPDGSAGTLPAKSQSDEPPLPVQTGFHVEADDYANTKVAEASVRPLGDGGTGSDKQTAFELAT